MTPDDFKLYAATEAAIHEQTKVTGAVTDEAIQGALLAAIVFGSKLKLDDDQIVERLRHYLDQWRDYKNLKAQIVARRKSK
jgi:hypothetical protein